MKIYFRKEEIKTGVKQYFMLGRRMLFRNVGSDFQLTTRRYITQYLL
jgi:hypothetical protein